MPCFFTVTLAFSWSYRLTFKGIQLITHHLTSLEYADDKILFTLNTDGLQEILNFLVTTAEPFGLCLSPTKCELIYFHRPGSIDKAELPQIHVSTELLKWKSAVVYLGIRLAEDDSAQLKLSSIAYAEQNPWLSGSINRYSEDRRDKLCAPQCLHPCFVD